MERVSVADLLAQRAELLEKLKTVEDAIELMKDSAGAVKISTSKNLKNTHLCGIQVYKDQDFTEVADISSHEGYICKEDLAFLRQEIGDREGDSWRTVRG